MNGPLGDFDSQFLPDLVPEVCELVGDVLGVADRGVGVEDDVRVLGDVREEVGWGEVGLTQRGERGAAEGAAQDGQGDGEGPGGAWGEDSGSSRWGR